MPSPITCIRCALLFLLLTMVPIAAPCKTPQKLKTATGYIKLLRAYKKVSDADTQYYFAVRWLAAQQPNGIFWRGRSGWMSCNIQSAHKGIADSALPYLLQPFYNGDAHKGDTLVFTPMHGGRYAIPAVIPASAVNTLYMEGPNHQWLQLKIKSATTLPAHR